MKLQNPLTVLLGSVFASFAQAPEFRIGTQVSGLYGLYSTGVPTAEAGVQASVQGRLGDSGLQLRQVVGGGGCSTPDNGAANSADCSP